MKKLIVMRGLPSCGKSHTAREIAGTTGLILSTDEYFYTQLKPEQPDEYSWHPLFLEDAHNWNYKRAMFAMNEGHPLVIIDNTNISPLSPKRYVTYAVNQDYDVKICEPTSDWWMEIREYLYDKNQFRQELIDWSIELARLSESTHNVPVHAIQSMMWRWQTDITLDQILNAPEKVINQTS